MTTPVPPHLSDEEREGAAVCGVDCRPGDGLCNGYCHDNRVKAPPAIRLAPPLDRALDQLTRGAEGNGANLGAVECLSLLTALSTEREAGERDKARLDWLQQQVHDERDGSIGDVSLFGGWTGIAVEVGRSPITAQGDGTTLRDAIDAARAPSTETPHA